MININLTGDQSNASDTFTNFLIDKDAKYMVLEGVSGSGKSTLVSYLLSTMEPRMRMYALLLGDRSENRELDIKLSATTHKAAAVLSEVTGAPVRTIHSRLGLRAYNNYKTGETKFITTENTETMRNSLLVIDEGSFLSDENFELIDQYTEDCKILIIGDQYQLAPVGCISPIMDRIPCYRARLEEIVRHGGPIAQAGEIFRNTVKTGEWGSIPLDGKNVIHVDGPTFQEMVEAEFTSPDFDTGKARILAWTNKKVQQYNIHVRSAKGLPQHLTPDDTLITNKPVIAGKSCVLANTDAFVEITFVRREIEKEFGIKGRDVTFKGVDFFLPNDPYEVLKLLKKLKKEKDWPNFFNIKDNWLDFRPVFASTVHKSQGSTFDTVYVDLADIGNCFNPSDAARLLYVAITRAAKQVVLYGELPPKYGGLRN